MFKLFKEGESSSAKVVQC